MRNNGLGQFESGRRIFRQIIQSVLDQPSISLSLSFYWFWQLAFFQSPASLPYGVSGSPFLSSKLILLLASAATYALVWVGHERVAQGASRRAYRVALAGLMAVGTLLLSLSSTLLEASPVASLVGFGAPAVMGVGAALFVVELGRVFAQLGPRYALLAGVLGIFGGTALYVLRGALPLWAADAVLVVSPIAAMAFFVRSTRQFPKKRLFSHGLQTKLNFPNKLAATCFIQGIGLGCMTWILGLDSASSMGPIFYTAAFAVGGCVLAVTAFTLKMDFNHLVYQIGFPLMAFGFLLLACFPQQAGLSGFVLTIGYCYMYVMVTAIITYFSNCLNCSPGWIVSLSTFFLVLGQCGGMVGFEAYGVASFGSATYAEGPIASAMAFLLPTVALLLMSNENPVSAWGAIRPGDRRESGEESLFAKIASDYRLTARETEITELLARGRNKRAISQRLDLAEETVKTHIGNIYRKLLVHSQQELIDLVEGERQARER